MKCLVESDFMQRSIFFDLGWTLEDENHSQVDRARKVVDYCSKLGISSTIDKIFALQDEAGKNGIPNVFKYAVSHLELSDPQVTEVLKKATWDSSFMTLYDDAVKVLDLLSKNGDLGIIANQSKPVQDRLAAYGIDTYFKVIIASCDVGFEKPALDIFKLALQRMGKDDSENWMVGDRIDNDIVPAKKMGWKTIRILQGSHRMQQPISENERADYTLSTLSEIVEIFKSF
jgi:HAD superfamily hydrolase (TIGR01509 family)